MKSIFPLQNAVISLVVITLNVSCNSIYIDHDYPGLPFGDFDYQLGAQVIPGKIQCEYYDFGGSGVAYQDSDTINSGSGNLNPPDGSYLHEFRKNEPVDISYTKSRSIDDSEFNKVAPQMDQLYVGWTNPGEWTKYTVEVQKSGLYQVGIMYTANANGQIALSVNDSYTTAPLDISSTFHEQDTVPWRQWHHWNYLDNIAQIKLKKGRQTIVLHTVTTGQMNYDYLNFTYLRKL